MSDFNDRHGRSFEKVFGEDNELGEVPDELQEQYKDTMLTLRANHDIPLCLAEKHVKPEVLKMVLEHTGFEVDREDTIDEEESKRLVFQASKDGEGWRIPMDDRYGLMVVGEVTEEL